MDNIRFTYIYLRRQTEAGIDIDMEVRDSIEKRRSIRKFKDTPVDLELVSQLIDAAVAAPSAKNRQIGRASWRERV